MAAFIGILAFIIYLGGIILVILVVGGIGYFVLSCICPQYFVDKEIKSSGAKSTDVNPSRTQHYEYSDHKLSKHERDMIDEEETEDLFFDRNCNGVYDTFEN